MKPLLSIYKISILLLGMIFFGGNVVNALTFYSRSGQPTANSRTSWTTSSSGTGGSSPTTTQWGQTTHVFIIRSGDNMTQNAIWTFGNKLQINNGGSFTTSSNSGFSFTLNNTLTISGTLTVSGTALKSFGNTITVNSGGILSIDNTSDAIIMSGDVIVTSGGIFKHHVNYPNGIGSNYLQIDGNLSFTGTAAYDYSGFTPSIWMNGSGAHTIATGGTSLFYLLIRTGNLSASGPVTVDGPFYASWNDPSGSFHTNNQNVISNNVLVNAGGSLYVDGGSLTINNPQGLLSGNTTGGGNGNVVVSAGTFTTPAINMGLSGNYTSTFSQNGGTIVTSDLNISNGSTFTETAGLLTVNNNLNINDATSKFSQTTGTSTVNIKNLNNNGIYTTGTGSAAINIAGNWTNNFTFTTSVANIVTFNGTANQTIGGTSSTTFNNLTINNPTSVSITKDPTVNSTLTLTNGKLILGTNNLILANSAAAIAGGPFSATKMIVADGGGEVRKMMSSTGSYFFPVGDNSGTAEYSPITLNYSSGTLAGGAYTGVKVVNSKYSNNLSSTDYLNRYWTISNSGITSPSFTAIANYVSADIAGTEAKIVSGKYAGSIPWTKYGVIGSNTLTATSISNTGSGTVVTGISGQAPVATLTNTGYCSGGSVVLSPVISNATSTMTYAWSPATGLSSTTIANPTSTPASNITYTLLVTDGNGFTNSANITLTQNPAGSWTGGFSTDWNDIRNWVCGPIPTSSTDVNIPGGLSYYPVINSGIDYVKNITVQSGGSLSITGGTLQISGAISNSGTFDVSSGSLEMSGNVSQTISGSMFVNKTINNLKVSNTSVAGLSVSSTAGDTLKITGLLSFGNSNSIFNTGDNVTLVSNSSGTARVGIVGINNAINGKAVVERYINTGTSSGQHAKSWQFLSTPTNGQTIKQSWMESGSTPGNYGTTISGVGGVAAGFDMMTALPSMKIYNYLTNNWEGISGTNIPIYDSRGYMVFVRGDRSVTAFNQAANTTTLRTKGNLLIGNLPPIAIAVDHYQSVGNPYASPIDFSLIDKIDGVDDKFYVWDPYLYGSYGLGGYQVMSSVSSWEPVPGGTTAYPSSVACKTIQSGQAFFVHATYNPLIPSQSPTISFTEDCKAVGSSGNVSRQMELSSTNNYQSLRANLFAEVNQKTIMADGNLVVFNKTFSDVVDGNDALKISNNGENFGIKSAGKLLAIEAKAPLNTADTIFYNMSNLAKGTYQLRFAPKNMETTGLQAFLLDKFLNNETSVSLTDSTFVNVNITSDAKSSASDRFKIVFREMGPLPVTITSITAVSKDNDILVQWNVSNEIGINQYEIEKSKDGNQFEKITVVNSLNKSNSTYNYRDENVAAGTYSYRIKIVSIDGKISYTQIVKVVTKDLGQSISVYPNPVKDGVIHLHLNNQPSGAYKIKLYNEIGQVMVSKNIIHSDGNSTETINCINLPKAIYQLEIVKPDNESEIIKIKN